MQTQISVKRVLNSPISQIKSLTCDCWLSFPSSLSSLINNLSTYGRHLSSIQSCWLCVEVHFRLFESSFKSLMNAETLLLQMHHPRDADQRHQSHVRHLHLLLAAAAGNGITNINSNTAGWFFEESTAQCEFNCDTKQLIVDANFMLLFQNN